jgi:SAM-dependent methyltransferase
MLERVTFLPGDLRQTPFPGGRDLILLFNVVHGLTRDENREVVKRALEALRPGGKLYILDQCLETGNRSDLSRFLPLMVGLNLLNETGGGIYDRGEILDWCQAARTVRPVRLLLPGLTLVEAVR